MTIEANLHAAKRFHRRHWGQVWAGGAETGRARRHRLHGAHRLPPGHPSRSQPGLPPAGPPRPRRAASLPTPLAASRPPQRGHLPDLLKLLAWTTPEVIRSFQPGARLAVVVRDPAVRAASQFMNDCYFACKVPDGDPAAPTLAAKEPGWEFCRCPVTAENFAGLMDDALPVAEARLSCFSRPHRSSGGAPATAEGRAGRSPA